MNTSTPEFVPSWDLPWELVRLANRDQIETVIVHGKVRLVNGQPVDWDGAQLLDRARAVSARVVSSSPIHTIDPSSGEHRSARSGTGARR